MAMSWWRRGPRAWTVRVFSYHGLVPDPLPVSDPCFHDVELFRRHLAVFSDLFDILPLTEAIRRLRAGELSGPTAAITFDDGFRSNYELAYPELRRRGVPATVFMTTGLLGTADTLWYCRVHEAVSRTGVADVEWDGDRIALDGPAGPSSACADIQNRLKSLPPQERTQALHRVLTELGVDPRREIGIESPYRMLDRHAIREMHASGLVAFGAHTHSHPILSGLPPDEQRSEIAESLKAVEDVIGLPCKLFAYPNGQAGDFDADTLGIVNELGVDLAVTTMFGANHASTDVHRIRRQGASPKLDQKQLRVELERMLAEDRRAAG